MGPQVSLRVKRNIQIHENENITHQILQYSAKAVLRGTFIILKIIH